MSAGSPSSLIPRPCFQQDLETVQIIYAHHVLTGSGSFETEPPSLELMTRRWSVIAGHGWPFVVACPASDPSRVMGFAYAVRFRDRPAYAHTYETSVYAAPTTPRRGAGLTAMYEVLMQLRELGGRQALALIGDSENAASIGLHVKLGFKRAGLLAEVGEKFGRALDVVVMQRRLSDG
jgi:phosphinothricin acetyltransferase